MEITTIVSGRVRPSHVPEGADFTDPRVVLHGALAALFLGACGGGGGAAIPSGQMVVNSRPEVRVGPEQYVQTGATIFLDASASTDPDGDALTFAWSLSSIGPNSNQAQLSDPTSATPTFVTATARGIYTATVTVSDGKESAARQVVITSTPVGLTLIEIDLFGAPHFLDFPYGRTRNFDITTTAPVATLARYKMVVQGAGQFTVSNLRVSLLTSGSPPAMFSSFDGLVDGRVLSAGPPVFFTLQSTKTGGTSALEYAFDIQELMPYGQFRHAGQVTTR